MKKAIKEFFDQCDAIINYFDFFDLAIKEYTNSISTSEANKEMKMALRFFWIALIIQKKQRAIFD